MKKEKKLLFSVTVKDCRVDTFRAGGKGGQNQNKVESGVRIVHEPSGAVGEARDSRDQLHNKRNAWKRMINSPEFKSWHRNEIERLLNPGSIDGVVEEMMQPENLKYEVFEYGKWNVKPLTEEEVAL